MELRAWAETILHTPDMSAKLLRPGVLTDHRPGAPGAIPRAPAREAGLSWLDPRQRVKVPFPTVAQMDCDERRGVVLHFFANHELLALELMALALLRFPDAPAAFRRGIAGVMQEEQSHLQRYIARMEELGVPFGAVPVNSYFWDVMSPMQSPLVFTAQMALTFEQANLDYAQHFLQAFKQVGDHLTAELMDVVYREELGHVGHGVLWFNRWRDPGESDWQAYKRILPLPLTPARAKGPGMQVAARRSAGLSEEFVRELGIYRHSKGRPPRLFWFNPQVEEELALGSSYTQPQVLAAWNRDMASVMQFLAGDEDAVLVPERPTMGFLEDLLQVGYKVPQFVTPQDRSELKGRLFERWHPWGQSPAARTEAASLGVRWQQEPLLPPAKVFTKSWAKQLAAQLAPGGFAGGVYSTAADVDQTVRSLSKSGEVVIKAALGCAGRNMQRVRQGQELSANQQRWVERILTQQGSVVVEPWVKRLADYSVQIEVQDSAVSVLGITRFLTDARGAYQGHVLGLKHAGLPPLVVRAYHELGVAEALRQVGTAVGEALIKAGYEGPAGIDAFLYDDGAGIKLRPLVEVNTRYTMGRIALELDRRIPSKTTAVWRHLSLAQVQALGHKDFTAFVTTMRGDHPLRYSRGFIEQGVLATNDPSLAKVVLSVLIVSPQAQNANFDAD